MEGLTVSRHPEAPDDVGFGDFFGPLLPHFTEHHWLCSDVLFSLPDTWKVTFDRSLGRCTGGPEWQQFSGMTLAKVRTSFIAAPGFLQAYARFMYGKWGGVIALSQRPSDPKGLLESLCTFHGLESLVAAHKDFAAVFCCYDGWLWAFYSRDRALVEVAHGYLSTRSDVRVEPASLEITEE